MRKDSAIVLGEANDKFVFVKRTNCDGGLVSNVPTQLLLTLFINYICENH